MKHLACIFVERGWVELDKESAFRYLTHQETIDFIESRAYLDKCNSYWPLFKTTNRQPTYVSDIKITKAIEVDKINLVTRYTEWAPRQVIEALQFLCEVQKYCMSHGYYLQTHIWNIVLRRGKPFLIDLGDFFKFKGDEATILGSITDSFIKSKSNHSPVLFSKWIPEYNNFLISIENIVNNKQKNILEKLDAISSELSLIKPTSSGAWSNYAKEEKDIWLETSDIPTLHNNKSLHLCNYIKEHKPRTVFDVGCNTGIYSFYASSLGAECIGIDTDLRSLEVANKIAATRNLNCSFVAYDIMKEPVAYGRNGAYESPSKRFRSEMVIASAIYHHLYRQGHSSESIINELIKYSSKYICLEFIPHHDEHISVKEDQWDTMGNVLQIFKKNNFNTTTLPSFPNPRMWIMAEKI
jgi:SAM-dependent methyltransferase